MTFDASSLGAISLFMGAMLDALIGPNLFVPGEPFLIAAGYQLHQGTWLGVILVLTGAWIGDQTSYWIGRTIGKDAQRKLTRWQPKSRKPFARARLLMLKKERSVLIFSRLLGPVAWVVPFLAGVNRIPYRRFTLLSSIGLILGVGQFIIWGYLLSYGVESIPFISDILLFANEHLYSLLVISSTLIFVIIGLYKKWRWLSLKAGLLFTIAALLANYSHFFLRADDLVAELDLTSPQTSISSVQGLSLKAFPGRSAVYDAQAINVIYIGETPRPTMLNLGWIENKTFSRNNIEWNDYLNLLRSKTPPVSDLFWNGKPQNMAFQLPGDLMKRSHIRWWSVGTWQGDGNVPSAGKKVWVGALSYDNGLQLTPYSGIVTVLHSIEPNVDYERDLFAQQIQQLPDHSIRFKLATPPIKHDEEHDYFTDGHILVIERDLNTDTYQTNPT
ncbi:LssY C-terminal domain-containing protein [Vibrio sp. ZSDE26]|uniref:LssY C-terminal domain-containing protein n=1 Tax=Vibrio amylolyticus TaxID=2847292 RepID=A0A9X2BIZ5_9VIBR|nr:LssY C-terminal domain-containing protein [Vibrio amylolyticus]MCK6264650.1 LssY C-terminal domain-containing protein [Vibrio amylolyticus]